MWEDSLEQSQGLNRRWREGKHGESAAAAKGQSTVGEEARATSAIVLSQRVQLHKRDKSSADESESWELLCDSQTTIAEPL